MPAIATAPVKYAGRTYVIECAIVMSLYVAAIWARPWLIAHAANPSLALAATVLPALPIWLIPVIVWRFYRHVDELERIRLLESIAIAFGLGGSAIITYAFLMDAGWPPLSLMWGWPVLVGFWGLTRGVQQMVTR